MPAALLIGLHAFAVPAHAQAAFWREPGLSVRADWLQATAMPLNREALHSGSAALAYTRREWVIELGWLRVARDLSNAQGAFATLNRSLQWRDALVLAGLGVFGGSAEASRDTTGYNWVGATATDVGHVPRYSHSRAAAFGGGALLAVEYPARSIVGFRASVAQWMFSGQPLTGDRQRTLAGAGITVRFGNGVFSTQSSADSRRQEGAR